MNGLSTDAARFRSTPAFAKDCGNVAAAQSHRSGVIVYSCPLTYKQLGQVTKIVISTCIWKDQGPRYYSRPHYHNLYSQSHLSMTESVVIQHQPASEFISIRSVEPSFGNLIRLASQSGRQTTLNNEMQAPLFRVCTVSFSEIPSTISFFLGKEQAQMKRRNQKVWITRGQHLQLAMLTMTRIMYIIITRKKGLIRKRRSRTLKRESKNTPTGRARPLVQQGISMSARRGKT